MVLRGETESIQKIKNRPRYCKDKTKEPKFKEPLYITTSLTQKNRSNLLRRKTKNDLTTLVIYKLHFLCKPGETVKFLES